MKKYLVFIINHNSKEKDNISIKFPFLKKFNYEIFYQNELDKNISFIGEKLIITHLTSGIIIAINNTNNNTKYNTFQTVCFGRTYFQAKYATIQINTAVAKF